MHSFKTVLIEKDTDALLPVANEDEEHELLELETAAPVETAFEKTLTSSIRERKGRGVFGGARGKFGGGGAFVRRLKKHQRWSSRQEESGHLADDSSPEIIRHASLALDEDYTADFGSFLSADLSGAFQQSNVETKLRSQSSIDFSSTECSEVLVHSRSSSSIPLVDPPARRVPQRSYSVLLSESRVESDCSYVNPIYHYGEVQKKPAVGCRKFQRSHSLALGTRSDSAFQSSLRSNQLSLSVMKGGFLGENANPNADLDAIEQMGSIHGPEPGPKRHRGRRHSSLGTSLFEREASSSGTSTTSSMNSFNNIPTDPGWLAPCTESPFVGGTPSGYLGESNNATTIFSQSSSPASQSVTSSNRKRGVCGSPVSDQDDWLTMSGSSFSEAKRNRSIFSLPQGVDMPVAPLESSKYHVKEEIFGCSRSSLPMNDSSDDESVLHHSSPDTSFDIGLPKENNDVLNPLPIERSQEEQIKAIFDKMSSYDDLKFLIRELRKEEKHHINNFIPDGMWKIAIHISWSSQRTSNFKEWAENQLGFRMRAIGRGLHFVQIPKEKGAQLLKALEAAHREHHRQQEMLNDVHKEDIKVSENNVGILNTLFTPIGSQIIEDPISIVRSILVASPEDAIMSEGADELTTKISSLSINEPPSTSVNSSLSRMVTLLNDESNTADIRVSVDHRVSRSSIDSHCQGMVDLNSHLLGISPKIPLGKPPRMSMGKEYYMETAVITHAAPRRSASPIDKNMAATCHTNQFVATPLINIKRDWGSRPIEGRDWGGSESYDIGAIAHLIQRFEDICKADDPGDTETLEDDIGDFGRHSSRLNFDLEINTVGEFDEDDVYLVEQRNQETRQIRRRECNIQKHRRMSLFAAAAGAQSRHPRESRLSAFETTARLEDVSEDADVAEIVGHTENVIARIFSFMSECDLLITASSVNKFWADCATDAHAELLLSSVSCFEDDGLNENVKKFSLEPAMERSWKSLHIQFPWACFLAEGGAKKVYRVHNASMNQEEALSVMDTHRMENARIVANELAVSAMLSSLVRRAVCPNFIVIRGVFTLAHPPPESHWGDEEVKQPKGKQFAPGKKIKPPQTPKVGDSGRYQYIRMELVNEGDTEELIKRQKDEVFEVPVAKGLLFQIAFAMFAAAGKFSVKHYDVKSLNVFVNRDLEAEQGLVLRYGLGSHIFAIKMPASSPYIAKLADFGTANTDSASNGQPVTMAHFTTLENTPPDYLILGDDATQGHEHDNFGLGLVMLHLFTGYRPYEEILDKVRCPPHLKKRLRKIWEDENVGGYTVLRTVILDDTRDIMYDTLYRFLVLFGIPDIRFQQKTCPLVWKAISDTLESSATIRARDGRVAGKRVNVDVAQYNRDLKKFSLRTGNNKFIARARESLSGIEGGLDLLFGLCSFDPKRRLTASHVLNSPFMESFREQPGTVYPKGLTVRSYTAFGMHPN